MHKSHTVRENVITVHAFKYKRKTGLNNISKGLMIANFLLFILLFIFSRYLT